MINRLVILLFYLKKFDCIIKILPLLGIIVILFEQVALNVTPAKKCSIIKAMLIKS